MRYRHTERKTHTKKAKLCNPLLLWLQPKRKKKRILFRISQISKSLPNVHIEFVSFFLPLLRCSRGVERARQRKKKTIHTPYSIWHQTKHILKLIFNYLIHLTNVVNSSKNHCSFSLLQLNFASNQKSKNKNKIIIITKRRLIKRFERCFLE